MSEQSFEVQEKLAELEAALLEGTPNMPVILRTIYKQLKADPDLVTILSSEEASLIVRGLKKQTGAVIATKALKSSNARKSLKNTTVDDL